LIGGSVNISAVCYLYRHHGKNNTASNLTCGNKRFFNDKYTEKLIDNNIKIRLDAIRMFKKNKSDLIKKYNKINYYKMFLKLIFCINAKICANIVRLFAHKIIQ
jgi:ribosomal protein S26